jgi:hypothetical protein
MEATLGKEVSTRVVAWSMFGVLYEKFMQCSEKERRSIARSDIEFIYIAKTLAIQKVLHMSNKAITEDLEREVYQNIWISTPLSDIPKIPRGNELIWSDAGDPIKEQTPKDKKRSKKIATVVYAIWDNVQELYPEEYAKAWPVFLRATEKGRLMINTTHKEKSDVILHGTGVKFYHVAVPSFTSLVIDEITKVCNLGRKERREMYTRVADATWKKLV